MAFGVSPFLLSFVSKTVCFLKRQDHTAEFSQGAAFDPVEVCDVEGRDGDVMEDGHGSSGEFQVSGLLTDPVLADFPAGEFLPDILSCF